MMKLLLVVVAIAATQFGAITGALVDLQAGLPILGGLLRPNGVSQGSNKQQQYGKRVNLDEKLDYAKDENKYGNNYYSQSGGYPNNYPIDVYPSYPNHYPRYPQYPQYPNDVYIPRPRPRQIPSVSYGNNQGSDSNARLNYSKNLNAAEKAKNAQSDYYNSGRVYPY